MLEEEDAILETRDETFLTDLFRGRASSRSEREDLLASKRRVATIQIQSVTTCFFAMEAILVRRLLPFNFLVIPSCTPMFQRRFSIAPEVCFSLPAFDDYWFVIHNNNSIIFDLFPFVILNVHFPFFVLVKVF